MQNKILRIFTLCLIFVHFKRVAACFHVVILVLPGMEEAEIVTGEDMYASKNELVEKYMVSVGSQWLCLTCGYKSKNMGNTKRHISTRHLKVDKFPCSMCDKVYYRSDHRIDHYKKAHHLVLTSKEARLIDEKKANF